MTPFHEPQPALYYSRRGRTRTLEEMKKAFEQNEQAVLERQFQMQEVIRMIEGNDGIPEELKNFLKVQLDALAGTLPPIRPVPTLEQLKRQEIEQAAERYAGAYYEFRESGAFVTYDMRSLLMQADRFEYSPEISGRVGPRVDLYRAGEMFETLKDGAALYMVRYLRYLGILELMETRKKCEACGDGPPKECDECGGLGWTI